MTVFSNEGQREKQSDLLVDGDGFATASFKLSDGKGHPGHHGAGVEVERSKTATTGGGSMLHNKVSYISSDDL